jgi:hypothetical protein
MTHFPHWLHLLVGFQERRRQAVCDVRGRQGSSGERSELRLDGFELFCGSALSLPKPDGRNFHQELSTSTSAGLRSCRHLDHIMTGKAVQRHSYKPASDG